MYAPFVFYIKIFICLIAICVFISMLDYFKYEKFLNFEMPIIMLLCLEGMFLMVSANDFFIMYLALELQSLSLYILAALKRYSNSSAEAGVKYSMYGSFASGILLYGVSLIYGSIGSTCYNDLYYFIAMDVQASNNLPLSLYLV